MLESAHVYARYARRLSQYWERPLAITALKLLLGRVFFGRGPREFDEYRFSVKPVWEWRSYVVERERKRMQERAAPACFREIEEDKVRFWARCTDASLPTVPITAVIAARDDAHVDERVPVAPTGADLERILEPLGDFDGFAKPEGGGQGYGAFTFRLRNGVVTMQGGEKSVQGLFDHATSLPFSGDGYILQPRLRVHPGLAGVMPGPGLGTVRLVSFLGPDGNVEIPWAVMRIPGPGQIADKFRLGALMVPVDLVTGRLGTAAGATEQIQEVHDVHYQPDTGVRFSDVVVPDWDKTMSMVIRGSHEFEELPCLGWDVALTDQGPVLLETNWAFGITTPQIALDRGLREELRRHYARCTGPGS